MIIYFDDLPFDWQPTVGDLTDNGRRYFAAPLWQPLTVLVLQEPVAGININYELFGRKFDCLIGWHDEGAPLGFTQPQNAGMRHGKLSLLDQVVKTMPHDVTFTEFLAGCPPPPGPLDRPVLTTGQQVTLRLPKLLLETVAGITPRYGHNLDTLVWELLHQWCEDKMY